MIERFKSVKSLGDKTIKPLSERAIHWTYNIESVAVIVKHLCGNMILRWIDFLTSDGEKGYRNRDEEFIDGISLKPELTIVWEKGWKTLIDIYSRKKLFSWNILTDASEFFHTP
ncbi:DUF1572 family protein [Peribacillus sp. YIM B13472]|uniref:DUF1572 family protein n=1 Tax=Peribacillus sp. YIM B13472 TaxID=3366297 RepID=UPI003671CE92